MNRASTAALEHDHTVSMVHAFEDEAIAARCDTPLLITASSSEAVDALARRVHAASARWVSPFVSVRASALPIDADTLSATCSNVIRTADGGTVLIAGVEDLPPIVQDQLLGVLAELQMPPAATIRLIAGTTVSLFDRVAAGTFSEELFYRLNVVHLMTRDGRAIAGD